MRSFARDLGLSPAMLSGLINQKKGISSEKAVKIANILNLTSDEKRIFLLSVQAYHHRKQSQKDKALTELNYQLNRIQKTVFLKEHQMESLTEWYHLAALELFELDGCEHSVEWIAKRLDLEPHVARQALMALQYAGLLMQTENGYSITVPSTITSFDMPSKATQKYHISTMSKAKEVLLSSKAEEREFLNLTLSFEAEKVEEAKNYIRQFQEKFIKKFYRENCSKNSVYQLSLHFFRVDQE